MVPENIRLRNAIVEYRKSLIRKWVQASTTNSESAYANAFKDCLELFMATVFNNVIGDGVDG